MDDLDPKEEDGAEASENIDELILSEIDDVEDADEGFDSGAFSLY